MPRKRTGTIQPFVREGKRLYRARITLGNGKRPWFELPAGLSESAAREYAASLQEQEDESGRLLAAWDAKERARCVSHAQGYAGETCDDWHERFLASRAGEVGNVESSRGRWKRWVSPIIGSVPMGTVSMAKIEEVRDHLDAALRRFRTEGRGEGRLMPKSALNVWSVVTTAFRHAAQSKDRTLRVREDNPCGRVLPPESGESRRRSFLYPTEIDLLLACADVPERWRAVYAVALYSYLRPGELWELRVRDIDLAVGLISVARAWDWRAKAAKRPKTSNGVRSVPIETSLSPLLARLVRDRSPNDLLFPELRTFNENKIARRFRGHLRQAGVARSQLFDDTATHMPVNFRSLRDTGITWLAIGGLETARIQRRAGHDDISTTLGYVKQAEDVGGRLGATFAALPENLLLPSARIVCEEEIKGLANESSSSEPERGAPTVRNPPQPSRGSAFDSLLRHLGYLPEGATTKQAIR